MTTRVVAEDIAGLVAAHDSWPALAGRSFLVTGATGMIGRYLVRALAELGRRTTPTRVVAMTRNGERAARLFASDSCDPAPEVVAHDAAARPLPPLGRLDYIVHAGSPADPAAYRDDPVGVISANVDGAANLLSAARESAAVFCLLSTAEVYGQTPSADGRRVTETDPGVLDSLALRSAYPESKRLAETLCVAYESQHGVSYRIGRLAHTYGPGMGLQDPRVQAYFFRQALAGRDIALQSSGAARRTYTYVSDAVAGLLHLLSVPESLVCNIANEDATTSILEFASAVLACCPGAADGPKVCTPDVSGEPPTVAPPLLDCSRLRGLGWAPQVSLEAGIRRTLQHHRELLARGADLG